MAGFACARTRTRSARYIHANPRIAIEIVDATIAIVPGGEISAVDAGPGLRVTAVRVPVALTTLTMWEVPKARLALAAGPTVSVGATLAAASLDVAEIVEGADAVAVARNAALRAESIGSRRATVATSADHVRLARAHPAVILTQKTARARWVTFAGMSSIENIIADAVLILLADLG